MPPTKVNVRDLAVKAFWTCVVAIGGLAVVELADWRHVFAPVVILALQVVVSYARQRVGGRAPDMTDGNVHVANAVYTTPAAAGVTVITPPVSGYGGRRVA